MSQLDEVVAALREALRLLEEADRIVAPALVTEGTAGSTDSALSEDAQLLEELLHEATHELARELAPTLHDIEILRRRLVLRKKYAHLGPVEPIVRAGWSLSLVDDLARERGLAHEGLGDAVQALLDEWHALPKLACVQES